MDTPKKVVNMFYFLIYVMKKGKLHFDWVCEEDEYLYGQFAVIFLQLPCG